MLFIFHVDTGTTITFDIKLALKNVSELKEAIERECGVPTSQQVLLMSGGESLESHIRVCTYSAGTDTNPIYLFSKAAIESQVPPVPSIDYGSDVDLQSQVDASLTLPASYQTLVTRSQLAQHCCGLAKEQKRISERLVHDQHLQQQGWAAVVANLEDITQSFQSRAEMLQQSFAIYLTERQQHMELLANFNSDLRTLEKIPILPALRAHADGLLSPDDKQPDATAVATAAMVEAVSAAATVVQETSTEAADALSLLKWISAKDNQSSLEQVADQCSRGLEQFDERVMEALKNEVNCAIDAANKQEMKEIKGLGERLFALETLMAQTKKLVHEQNELAQGFQQNKTRVSNLNDDSVLPDLCNSHRRQLCVMLENHNQLRDIRRRCTKAKEELSVNIHRRLKWIMYVENKMMEVDGKLVMYHESLRRLRRQLEILRQIHLAPEMYVSAIAEVVRRRTFSQAFLVWASNLACQLLSVHSEEIERRREFQSKFEGHFLNSLFPGLEDIPPPYATQAPSVFDNGLPKLTAEDMESLRQQLPDLTSSVSTPDLSSITQFFFSKSLTESSSDGNKEKESTSMRVDPPPKEQEGARPPLISDRGGFESETDTEEFEKIGQAAMDSKLTSYESTKQPHNENRQKQLEENLGSTREEVERLRTLVRNMKAVATDSLLSLRRELDSMKVQTIIDKTDASIILENIGESVKLHTCALKEREQELTIEHELELSDLKKMLQSKDEEVQNLNRSLIEKEREAAEQERLIATVRQNLHEQIEKRLAAEKKLPQIEMKNAEQECLMWDRDSVESMDICEEKIRELEEKLAAAEKEHQKIIKEETEKLQARNEEVQNLNRTLMEKETEVAEQERLIATMRQKSESEQQEMKELKSIYRQLEERFNLTQIKMKNAEQECLMWERTSADSMDLCQERIRELEDKLAAAEKQHEKTIKEETEKLQLEYKTQMETIRSRFKLMAASTMERSPSDSSLEKIERVDMIELVNHETILDQTKKDLEAEKAEAIREAIERERTSLNKDLQMFKEIITKNEHKLDVYRQREAALVEECRHYKSTLQRLNEAEALIRNLESDKAALECKISVDQKELEQRENLVRHLEMERDGLRQELNDERLKMSQTELAEPLKAIEQPEKDEVRVSESKKVRLEADSDLVSFPGRIDVLEADNKRLTSKIEVLENERIRLEVELGKVKERSKRNLSAESLSSSSISASEGSRDKDMNASVSVVTEVSTSNRVDAATSTERSRREVSSSSSHAIRDKLTKSTTSLVQQSKINFTSCNPGDIVLILWDQTHRNFTVLQESQTFYFLNSDCIGDLDLKLNTGGLPTKLHAVAVVVEKEYCSARKPENRYRVPQGTKFYRVRVKPLQRHAAVSKDQ